MWFLLSKNARRAKSIKYIYMSKYFFLARLFINYLITTYFICKETLYIILLTSF